jgi:pimeloyl-ACP methyl ester carboxylesterase
MDGDERQAIQRGWATGTELYREVYGSGPPVLLISGATGDVEHSEPIAESLADEFTVVTCDRGGNLRSPRPQGWESTPTEEQADDAAKLIVALVRAQGDLVPAGGPLNLPRLTVVSINTGPVDSGNYK